MSGTEFKDNIVQFMGSLKLQALRLTNYDPEDANDLTQETILKAMLNRKKYKEDRNFKSWLGVIMRNTFINGYRRKYHYKTRIQATEAEIMDRYENTARTNIVSNIILTDVMDALDSLPEKNRMPIIRYYEGYSYDEISNEYHIPLTKVKSRIFAGREILRKALSDYRDREY